VEGAPRPAALVRDFVNTLDVEEGTDAIAAPDALASWLREHDLLAPGEGVAPEDVATAALLREALRTMLRAHHGGPAPADALGRVNALVARLPLAVSFDARGSAAVKPALGGAPGALAGIVAAVAAAAGGATWGRLKVCAESSCQWAFYDRSRNRSGRWCSMAVCGNRSKTRAYRRRWTSSPRGRAPG